VQAQSDPARLLPRLLPAPPGPGGPVQTSRSLYSTVEQLSVVVPGRLYLSCPRISPAPSPARSDPADPAVLRRIVRMAVLVEGQKFALSSKSQTSKSVVYVKLTDSALRSLEDYLKNKAVLDCRRGPCLQFSENGGVLLFPSQGGRESEYSFELKDSKNGGSNKQERTDCLMSTNSTLESVGSMSETLRVNASNETFRITAQKFTDVKLENEKKSTVLLESKDKKKASLPKSQVVRKIHKSGVAGVSSSRTLQSGGSSGSPASPSQSYSGLGPGRGSTRPQSPVKTLPPPPPAPVQRPPCSSSSLQNNQHKSYQAPKPAPKPPLNTEIMKKSLRDRLLHLLAVRPYKKPELLLRMHKDGMKEKDKKNISQLLREVSDCRNNVYELRRSMWNDVAEDWPFYTEQDRAQLRRNKPQNLTPPGSDTGSTSSGHSPSSTNPPSPPPITNTLKRQTPYFPEASEAKKKRLSNYKRPGGSSSTSSSWDCKSPGLGAHSSLSPRLDMDYEKVQDDSVPDWGKWGQQDQERVQDSPDQSTQMQLAPNRNMDFITAYTSIVTLDQRQSYKADFNKSYTNYRKLHNVLDDVSKRFSHLESKLKQATRGSEEFKIVKARIMEEYEKNKKNQEYQEARSNFQYLHEKLAHIKKLVHDFDYGTNRVGSR